MFECIGPGVCQSCEWKAKTAFVKWHILLFLLISLSLSLFFSLSFFLSFSVSVSVCLCLCPSVSVSPPLTFRATPLLSVRRGTLNFWAKATGHLPFPMWWTACKGSSLSFLCSFSLSTLLYYGVMMWVRDMACYIHMYTVSHKYTHTLKHTCTCVHAHENLYRIAGNFSETQIFAIFVNKDPFAKNFCTQKFVT